MITTVCKIVMHDCLSWCEPTYGNPQPLTNAAWSFAIQTEACMSNILELDFLVVSLVKLREFSPVNPSTPLDVPGRTTDVRFTRPALRRTFLVQKVPLYDLSASHIQSFVRIRRWWCEVSMHILWSNCFRLVHVSFLPIYSWQSCVPQNADRKAICVLWQLSSFLYKWELINTLDR